MTLKRQINRTGSEMTEMLELLDKDLKTKDLVESGKHA